MFADVLVVGSGIAGLWTAKALLDKGVSVCVVERSMVLADGATLKNEGWLHSGSYHAVAVEDETEIDSVVAHTRESHQAICRFAPEAIATTSSLAVAYDATYAHRAEHRWGHYGISYERISASDMRHYAEDIDVSRLVAMYSVPDKSINTHMLCDKLRQYVLDKGGVIIAGADFQPEEPGYATIHVAGQTHTIEFRVAVVAAGNGTADLLTRVTGQRQAVRYFKAHLLMMPQVLRHNYFHIEPGEAGIMRHGDVSIAGLHRDGIELARPDESVVGETVQRISQAIACLSPRLAESARLASVPIVCHKPDFAMPRGGTQSLDIRVFNPAAGYIFCTPGKMTLAPYMASEVTRRVMNLLNGNAGDITNVIAARAARVGDRPADRFIGHAISRATQPHRAVS